MITFIGLDPGKTTGVCVVKVPEYKASWKSAEVNWHQLNHQAVPGFLNYLNQEYRPPSDSLYLFAEQFVAGNGAGAKGSQAEITRDVLKKAAWVLYYATYRETRPADVKPWSNDRRMKAAGLLYPYTGTAMRHCTDAARVLLYLSCKLGLMSDPLR
jgi:hypothetical protein